jgi:hypothetical protein
VYPDGTVMPEYTATYSALLKPLHAALCGGECEETIYKLPTATVCRQRRLKKPP